METQLKLLITDNTKTMIPEINSKLADLQENIRLEMNDNIMLKEQITKMKKQNTHLEKFIAKYEARIEQLEGMIGK